MSLSDVSMFYVLGEDPAHLTFIRAWLDANGVGHRRVHSIPTPAGKSGGCHFVLTHVRDTLHEARHRNRSKAKTRVIVAIDADDGTVEKRLSEIKNAVDGLDDDEVLELCCVLVPKRHIETWVHALEPESRPVDEQANYKEKSISEVKSAARRLARLSSAPSQPPSLVHGYGQLQRLKAS